MAAKKGGLANLKERISDIAKRAGDLSPLKAPIKTILFEGNRTNKRKGLAQDGQKYAKLAPSTIKRRPRPGNIPFVTTGDNSLIISDCLIDVRAGTGHLSFTQSWPATFWIEYHITPTHNRPARDPYGFRPIDINDIKAMMGPYVMGRAPTGVSSPEARKPWWKFWGK